MTGLREKLKAELDALGVQGRKMVVAISKAKPDDGSWVNILLMEYQEWYTRSLLVLHQLVPEREAEFVLLYEPSRKTGAILDPLTYGIKHALLGVRVTQACHEVFHPRGVTVSALMQQVSILQSAAGRLDSALASIRGVLQAELFDTEIDAAQDLVRNGHLRAAGAVAGVVLERHLAEVAVAHGVAVKKKNPSIADYNDAPKAAEVIDLRAWRRIQALYDVRTLCCHNKKREPRADEVAELVDGVGKLTKTLF
jgi:hypothetical protein